MRIFITGASGCVGHYLIELLLQKGFELFLLVRDPQKIQIPPHPKMHLIPGKLQQIAEQYDLLQTMDVVISAAASWGGTEEVFSTNVDGTCQLFQSLNPDRLQRAIYFSTASILDKHNQLLPEAETLGSPYIRSKYAALQKLENSWVADRLITVFPTLVFGGGAGKPYSHLSGGLKEVTNYIPLIRWFKFEGSFHFIHAIDIAQVIVYLVQNNPSPENNFSQRVVLGAPYLTVNRAISEACASFHTSIRWQIPLTSLLIDGIIKIFRIQVAAWDRFCLAQRHFVYDVVNPESFGLTSYYPSLTSLLQEVQVNETT